MEVALTPEAREFLQMLHDNVHFWKNVTDRTPEDLLNGFVHSVLVNIDGDGQADPVDLVVDGKVINGDVHLHEFWYR